MSKGSTRRPTQVPKDEAERRWEKTFRAFIDKTQRESDMMHYGVSIMEQEQPRMEAKNKAMRGYLDRLNA